MNRNSMTAHLKTCQATPGQRTKGIIVQPVPAPNPPPGLRASQVQITSTGSCIKWNSDEIKTLVMAKEDEMKRKEEAARLVAEAVQKQQQADETKKRKATGVLSQEPPPKIVAVAPAPIINAAPPGTPTLVVSPTTSTTLNLNPINVATVKDQDHYIPDNNSNNVISKTSIHPPPTVEELKQGYCVRKFNNSQQRFICTVCGKHYTTTYNMRQHQNIHSGSGLHTCRYCGRDFTHKHVWEVSKSPIRFTLKNTHWPTFFCCRRTRESTLEKGLSNAPTVRRISLTGATTTATGNFAPSRSEIRLPYSKHEK